MMRLCFMGLRPARDGEGREPDFPEGMSYVCVADLPNLDWGLYRYSPDAELGHWVPSRPVGEELSMLISSAIDKYPPAVAAARVDLEHEFRDKAPSQQEFSAVYSASLRRHLSGQSRAGFVLAEAVRDEPGYLSKGEWVWVLGVSKRDPDMVYWVSGDYYVYQNQAADFDLSNTQLKTLRAL